MILAKGEKCVTIDEPRKIDFVVFPKGRDDLVELWIADHLAWGYGDDDTVEHLVLLQEKVNSYLEYIGGQLTEDFPEAEGRRVVIRIRALEGAASGSEGRDQEAGVCSRRSRDRLRM